MRARDAHIEKLRTQQQTAKNNKEYQAFLVEINTAKVDRNKVEEDAIRTVRNSGLDYVLLGNRLFHKRH